MASHGRLRLAAAVALPAVAVSLLAGAGTATAGALRLDSRETRLTDLRQLTFGGENAEGYWSPDGKELILQSTHPPYACDQIFRLSPGRPGKMHLVSTGRGRTTCPYFTADGKRVIFSSTHALDASCPAPPDRSMGYVWALYDSYELYSARPDASDLRRLTDNTFYDAEATVCQQDGSIIFTSTRDGDLELYRMDADGSDVRRLTSTPGYDGGAFYSRDCTRIVWRASRFRTEEALTDYQELLRRGLVRPSKLEIWVADADGSDARQVTYLDAASFAPYFFPSGETIIFASNYGDAGGREFELWAVNQDGTGLERITYTPQFDGFPMFSPDGAQLVFASNRNQKERGETNLFVARWKDEPGTAAPGAADRFMQDVAWLAADARSGRGIGTRDLKRSAQWIAAHFRDIGLRPDADGPAYLQPFLVPVEVEAGEETALSAGGEAIPGDAFSVTGFSSSAEAVGEVVFAGHGITSEEHGFDDYENLDATGKVVLTRRFTPETGVFEDDDVRRRYSSLRYKAWNARQHGASGLLVVDLPEVEGDADLPEEAPFPKLGVDTRGDAGLPVAVVKRDLGRRLMSEGGEITLNVRLIVREEPAQNVVGYLQAGHPERHDGAILIGAHYDHLGMGGRHSMEPDKEEVHNGADDNASGVAALLEAGRILQKHRDRLKRDVWFVAFSGEEDGLLGSSTFVKRPPGGMEIHGLAAMVNMDMVGRLRDNRLTILGGDSAREWEEIVQPACQAARIECTLGGDGYGPSDQTSFYAAGVPVLHLFSGVHHEYHRPSDDAHLINAAGGAQVARLVAELALGLGERQEPLTYHAVPQPVTDSDTRSYGASLGTVPDYAGDPEGRAGVLLSGVRADSPAEKAGLPRGDLLVSVAGHEIRDIYDLVYVLRGARPGEKAEVVVVRDGKRLALEASFGARGRIR